MKIVDLKYADIDEFLENLYESEEFIQYPDYKINNWDKTGQTVVITQGAICRVTDLDLIFVEGVCYRYEDSTKEFDLDWSLTLIYQNESDDEFDIEEYIYWDENEPSAAIHNYIILTGGREQNQK